MSLESNLAFLLVIFVMVVPVAVVAAEPDRGSTLASPLSDEEAWKRLPKADEGGGEPLPSWARMLAGTLPRTTAAFLELDLAHRTRSPLDPKLRAAMRWVAAHGNRCSYAEAYAIADAGRAGLAQTKIDGLIRDNYPGWSDAERAALDFARKMTVDSDSVTDGEFARLVKDFGENQAASMVLLLAYSNFQDRLLLSLGAWIESRGPLPPLHVAFSPDVYASKTIPPPLLRRSPLPTPTGKDLVDDEPGWAALSYDALQARLEAQRGKPTRLRIPEWDEVARGLPPAFMKRPSAIVWNRICLGYAPQLAIPFERLMRTAGAETSAKWDRVFGQSLFWVTTRAMKCPYCMGHCEMNWEVAGLSKNEIAERSRLLAGEDWSSFSPAEQHAFAFARKLTRAPSTVTEAELNALKHDFGPELAVMVVFNACRYHYMTRISNGFQLTLERENVFYDYYNVKPPETHADSSASHPGEGAVPLLSDAECWNRMPRAESGTGQPLPNWARGVAVYLPRTAAAMLELDFAQRTKSPLDPVLRAKMRSVVAQANRCDYTQSYALADLRRAAGDDGAVRVLTGNPDGWPEADREPLEFARLLTVAAPTITDESFNRLRQRFGDKQVAAMVLLAAYGNFQDRIVLGLDLPLERGGPLAPLAVKFGQGAFQMTPIMPVQKEPPRLLESGQTVVERDPEWSALSFDDLQTRLERQRAKAPRLPIPSWDDVKKNLPPQLAARRTRIVWNLVCSGYVPELAIPWSVATRTMWAEAKPDRVFEESLFWIQTRSVRCNYCMGHCEMLLEVAGIDKAGVAERTRRLAGDDWSSFPPEEQRAYAYARKLSKAPWQLTLSDYRSLERDLGPARAAATFWWLCRGLYMTRVSDGFQLPLERDNVFRDFYGSSAADAKPAPK